VHGAHNPVALQPNTGDGCAVHTENPLVCDGSHATPVKPLTQTPVASQLSEFKHVPPTPLLPPMHTPFRLPRLLLSIAHTLLVHSTPVEHAPLLHAHLRVQH
jgi:hypothetical protein